MALVTIQRSPSGSSPQCSNSDGEAEDEESSKNEKSECFFAGKGTALVLALKDVPQGCAQRRLSTDSTRSTNSTQSNNSDIQQHLQSMFNLLRHEETLKMAVKLESQRPNRTRYLVIASRCCYRSATAERKSKITRNNSARATTSSATGAPVVVAQRQHSMDSGAQPTVEQSVCEADEMPAQEKRLSASLLLSTCANRQSVRCDGDKIAALATAATPATEESCLLGIDCNERATIGLVVPILADTTIHLDGDGGFSVSVFGKTHIFKPVSVQAMWSALQTLHKVSQKARENNFYPGGPSHDWLTYYERRIESDQSCLNEWNAMDALESRRPPSPDAIRNKPTAKEETESVIKTKLKEIMMSVDLDEVTSKYIRGRLEEHLDMDLGEYKSFIDEEMLMILGQMDAPTEIFEHVYLGSEWNASNLEELLKNGVRHILNVTREIDNFFPGMFDYFNVRVYDDEKTNLLKHWDNTYRYITRAKAEGSKVLVHCKMGVSRSASVVIAYAMKAYNWEFQQALQHVKARRNCIKPNKNFLNQLETYRGMLDAMKNKEKLQRSKSETNLKCTKDARLLPGSEPTPLIQALNQSKSKSTSSAGSDTGGASSAGGSAGGRFRGGVSVDSSGSGVGGGVHGGNDGRQRRVLRRSSSTSPKSIQCPSAVALVMKQQSQSLENLTPERSVADEPKNVRFPGSNGENYSVTQNQVLHIQKNTPAAPHPPPPMPAVPPTSVRTIVHGLEAHQDARKTADDRKTLNLQIARSASATDAEGSSGGGGGAGDDMAPPPSSGVGSVKSLGSPVWTSSAKLITQTSTLKAGRASAGGGELGSNSSIDSLASTATAASAPIETIVRTRPRHHREPPSRHASWGSGDHREPMRHASWSAAYDNNRNNFHYGGGIGGGTAGGATTSAIFEGQIHELNMRNKTANSYSAESSERLPPPPQQQQSKQQPPSESPQQQQHHLGTVKRTKQKLEEVTAMKKLCQSTDDATTAAATAPLESAESVRNAPAASPPKRSPSLFRSASAAGCTRSRYPNRCNSDEIGVGQWQSLAPQARRSEGSRPPSTALLAEAFAPPLTSADVYSMADIENKNTLPAEPLDEESATAAVVLRSPAGGGAVSEDQRISGNVQILKKSFEAKAGGTTAATATAGAATAGGVPATQTPAAPKKGHQSLPSSPVAQHVDHTTAASPAVGNAKAATPSIANNANHSSSLSSASSSSSSVSEPCDRNVKGLVHKYQATTAGPPVAPSATAAITTTVGASGAGGGGGGGGLKPRPRSYYENPHKSFAGKSHDFSDSKPPPAPAKPNPNPPPPPSPLPTMAESILVQPHPHQQQHQPPPHQQQQRRLQQHGKTHPLTKLSLPKQSFNAAAYNTM